MNRITLPIVVLFASAAVAQTPVAPRTARPIDTSLLGREVQRRITEEAREAQRMAIEESREAQRMAIEESREVQRIAVEQAREAQRMAIEDARAFAITPVPMPAIAPMAAMAPVAAMAPMAIHLGDRFDRLTAPRAWAPQDPADSLYRVAREALSRGDWGRSARLFADIQKNYPKSVYQNDAQYWEAYARYKIGTTDELRLASKLLEPLASRVEPGATNGDVRVTQAGQNRRTSDSEIVALYARVNGVLAQRGDADAAAKVEKAAAAKGQACDQEEASVRSEALNALSRIDPQQATPMLRRVLEQKDECSSSLRRNAVMILGRRADNESAPILLSVAKGDPNITVRTEAINYLSRTPGDAGVNALEEMLRTEQDERVQRAAIRALMASDNSRARASMRTLIDRKDAPLSLRVEAINSFNLDRATTDDAAYLRGLFAKADNDQLKNAIVNAVSRIGGTENDQWVISVARNNNESSTVRTNALSRLSRSPTITTADLAKLYDASAESYEIRNRIISMLGNRKDQEATDKLIDIVRNSTVIQNRTQAINALMNKKDPRATQLLMDILDGKKP
jgi:HEAT repeat protein/TolA-binding protein